MAGRSLASSNKWFVCASLTMQTAGSLASMAPDITTSVYIVGSCNLIGSNIFPTSSHQSFTAKIKTGRSCVAGTLCAHMYKTKTKNTTSQRLIAMPITSRSTMASLPSKASNLALRPGKTEKTEVTGFFRASSWKRRD